MRLGNMVVCFLKHVTTFDTGFHGLYRNIFANLFKYSKKKIYEALTERYTHSYFINFFSRRMFYSRISFNV